jgi:hypothetical protein
MGQNADEASELAGTREHLKDSCKHNRSEEILQTEQDHDRSRHHRHGSGGP